MIADNQERASGLKPRKRAVDRSRQPRPRSTCRQKKVCTARCDRWRAKATCGFHSRSLIGNPLLLLVFLCSCRGMSRPLECGAVRDHRDVFETAESNRHENLERLRSIGKPIGFEQQLTNLEPHMAEARSTIEAVPSRQRSAVTNGRRRFVVGDGNSAWARRQRDLEALYADDLGGTEQLTAIRRGLIRTAATLRVELEQLEGKLSQGEEVDVEKFARVASHYRRLCECLGLQRCAKDVVPTLESYLAAKANQRPSEHSETAA
jgi:hypothetical protein